ncbi:zinc-dependent alcohol dehydrogenase [Paenibacillus ferrarius]|uniref:zinc-dependent alcohol dehydrogenase n=1 Tax=Paenibacillus ferrarius TaxID=1469647 RepID=UPI003D290C0B
MRQLQAFGPRDLRIVEVQDPVLSSEDEVLIDIRACGICGSDKWYWSVDRLAAKIAGHEVAGRIIAVGDEVHHLRAGDRVAINNVQGCGYCEACQQGRYVRCANGVVHIGNGFADKVVVPARNCLKLDDDLSYAEGSLIFDNWGTPYAAIKRTSLQQDDRVAVIGCGPIGLAAVALVKSFGARVIAIDPIPERLKAAALLGAEACMTPSEVTAADVDIVLECSGKAASYELAQSILRIGGTLVAIGEGTAFTLTPKVLIHKHLTFLGSLYSSMEDGKQIQDMIRNGVIRPMSMVTHQFTMGQLQTAFGDIVECRHGLIKAVMVNDNRKE